MQELIKELVEKAGLSEASAEKAIATTMSFIKSKLPPMFSDKLEDLIQGKFDLSSMFGGGDAASGDSPIDKLKGLF